MLQRYIIHLALTFLFAFTQIGVAAHEIGHLTNSDQHTQQQDSKSKSTVAEQCAQCLTYAKVASGLAPEAVTPASVRAGIIADSVYFRSFSSTFARAYGARAPPQTISI